MVCVCFFSVFQTSNTNQNELRQIQQTFYYTILKYIVSLKIYVAFILLKIWKIFSKLS